MKKIIVTIVMLQSIMGNSFGQTLPKPGNNIFDLPENSIKRKFLADLGQGNKMQVELSGMDDMQYIMNIDSLLRGFINDIQGLQDSLGGNLVSKRIDYFFDSSPVKKIRVQKFLPNGSSFAVTDGEIFSLKLEQDTIAITGTHRSSTTSTFFRKMPALHYFRVSLFLNKLEDLPGLLDGRLNQQMKNIQENVNANWAVDPAGGVHLKNNIAITAPAARGFIGGMDYLTFRLSVDVQNYKNYFAPSASLDLAIVTNNNFVTREYGLGTEHHFLFSKNDSGKLQTIRSSFLTLSYGSISFKRAKENAGTLYPYFSLGYLIKRRGDIYEKNTFKLGVGRFSLFNGGTKIEPTIYFNNFFRGVTPSLRIVQSF